MLALEEKRAVGDRAHSQSRIDVPRLARTLLLITIALLPFELYVLPPDPSVLQLLFISIAAVAAPLFIRNWRSLLTDQLVVAALALAGVYWITALTGVDTSNAVKAAIRVSCGVALMIVWIIVGKTGPLRKIWACAAVAAAVYGLLDYAGVGVPALFRSTEYFVGDVQRLSGSFEYPNTAAAYFAMSLPIVASVSSVLTAPVWAALILTYSRGALLAVALMVAGVAIASRSVRTAKPLAVGIAVFAVLSAFRPFLIEGLRPTHTTERIAAKYELPFNRVRLDTNAVGVLPVAVRNTGSAEWPNAALSYHWYDAERRRIVYTAEILTPLPAVVRANELVQVDASFRTPSKPGFYLLSWDVRQNDRWFSIAAGVIPGVVEATIETGATEWRGNGDLRRWYRTDRPPAMDASVSRRDLWTAAWRLFMKHPLVGVGPDGFRLHYGQALGQSAWDSNIRSNSLYLELLSGSGLLGLLAFAVMLIAVRWNAQPALIGVLVFLVHGLVDVFLMTTPIYFAFWILLGQVHAHRV
jgi:hypothetical protein